jgi:hypothetical protein
MRLNNPNRRFSKRRPPFFLPPADGSPVDAVLSSERGHGGNVTQISHYWTSVEGRVALGIGQLP